MRDDDAPAPNLSGRTILIAGSDQIHAELADELQRCGAQIISLPGIEIAEDHDALFDGVMANLAGYDWIIFSSPSAVQGFLRHFTQLGHKISELDTMRVCAAGNATLQALAESLVHVDLVSSGTPGEIVISFEEYLGGRECLRGLSFLIAKSSTAPDSLSDALEETGARVDQVAMRATKLGSNSELTRINTLLAGGGIDCVVFMNRSDVINLNGLVDTGDLRQIPGDVRMACLDDIAAQAAANFALRADIITAQPGVSALVRAMATHFAR